MANAKRVQSAAAVLAIFLGIPLLLVPTTSGSPEHVTGAAPGRVVTDSALAPVFFWCLGWPIVFGRFQVLPVIRALWALGCAACLLHIAVAFEVRHGWSHEAAWEHTRQVGGYGGGIYVNYLFALVWVADVLWLWTRFESYRARPRWLNGAVHAFIAFVVFNAAVAFGSAESRLKFACWFCTGLVTLRVARTNEPGA